MIRAGRNLPDKEFRYLRTVIVTAAVYRGLTSVLLPHYCKITPPLDLPAPGTCHTLYVVLSTLQSAVFLLNSRLTQFTATFSGSLDGHPTQAPLIPKVRGHFA